MICVERLNGEILYLNWLQVELIEQIPETKIRMMNGDYYLVKDSVESIKDQMWESERHSPSICPLTSMREGAAERITISGTGD